MGQSPSILLDTVKNKPTSEQKSYLEDLIKQGVDVNYADEDGRTALHWAASTGEAWMISLLISKGAQVDQQDFNGCSPLFHAVFTGNSQAAQTLITEGKATIDAVNKDGMTPLHFAVSQNQFSCIELLLSKGASLDIKNKKDQTPRDIVQRLKSKQRSKMEAFIDQCLTGVPAQTEKIPESTTNHANVEVKPQSPSTLRINGSPQFGHKVDVSPEMASQISNNSRMKRLLALCKIWGLIKFTHPFFLHKDIDWDTAVLNGIREVNSATSSEDYKNAINRLLGQLDDTNTRCIGDERKRNVPASDNLMEQPYITWTDDSVAVFTATHHEKFQDYQQTKLFLDGFKELNGGKARAVIFDVRLKIGSPVSVASYPFKFMFYEAFRTVLQKEVRLPSFRQRVSCGYPQQRDFGNIFQSGVISLEGDELTPNLVGEPSSKAKWIFLVNRFTPESIINLASGLQIAGLASVIQEREVSSADIELGVSTFFTNIGENIVVSIRKNERVNSDGSLGFVPDLKVDVTEGEREDTGLFVALDVARGNKKLQPLKREQAHVYFRKVIDNEYSDTPYPSQEFRTLALFRFWTVIQYFFPYKPLMDRDWDEVFFEYLQKLEGTKNALEYAVTIAELVAKTCDSHASCSSAVLNHYIGSHMPPIEVRFIEGKTIITHFFAPIQEATGLSIGAEILAIDKIGVNERKAKLYSILPASTPQALQFKVHQKLLAGEKDSKVILDVRTPDGKIRSVALTRTILLSTFHTTTRETYSVLPEGYGFIDTVNLSNSEVEKALETIKNTPALILDIRGYPKGTIYHLAPRLTDKKVTVAITQTPFLLPSAIFTELESTILLEEHKVQPSPQWKYKGKVVALINEETISHAEHSCLYLEACTDVIFIGTATNGANGNVTNCHLPGGILVGFTGLGTLHGDKRQLQRQGIVPHIVAAPTIQGLVQGKDQVFEAALSYLNNKL